MHVGPRPEGADSMRTSGGHIAAEERTRYDIRGSSDAHTEPGEHQQNQGRLEAHMRTRCRTCF